MGNLCTQHRSKHLEVHQLEIPAGTTQAQWMQHCWPAIKKQLSQMEQLSITDDLWFLTHPFRKNVHFAMPKAALAARVQPGVSENWAFTHRKFFSSHAKYVMKFEPCERMCPNKPTELEHIQDLMNREDGVAEDPRVLFPECAFKVVEE